MAPAVVGKGQRTHFRADALTALLADAWTPFRNALAGRGAARSASGAACVTGGAGASVTSSIDRHMARALWMADGSSLLVGANDGTKVSLWVQPLSGPPRKLALGDVSPSSSFWVDLTVGKDGSVAFVGTTANRPAELYYLSSATATPKRLTDLNAATASLTLGRTEAIEWQS